MSSQLKLLTRTFRSIATYVHTITYLCVWWSMGFYSGINPAGKTSGPPKRPAIPQALDPSNHLRKLMWPMDVPKAARYALAYPDIPLRLCTTKIYQDLSSISSRPLDLDDAITSHLSDWRFHPNHPSLKCNCKPCPWHLLPPCGTASHALFRRMW